MLLNSLILITAFSGSVLAGLFGGGAGLIFTPAIFLFLSYNNPEANYVMQTTITTMITSMLLPGLIACFKQVSYRHVDWHIIRWSLLPIVFGSFVGCILMLSISSKFLTYIFAIATLFLAIRSVLSLYRQSHDEYMQSLKPGWFFRYIGSFSLGIISIVSGSASFVVPFYQRAGVNIKSAIGATTVTVWCYSLVAAITMILLGIKKVGLPQGNIGYLNYSYLMLFMLPTIPGIIIGANLSNFFSERTLKILFTFLLFIISVTMLVKVNI